MSVSDGHKAILMTQGLGPFIQALMNDQQEGSRMSAAFARCCDAWTKICSDATGNSDDLELLAVQLELIQATFEARKKKKGKDDE